MAEIGYATKCAFSIAGTFMVAHVVITDQSWITKLLAFLAKRGTEKLCKLDNEEHDYKLA